MSAPDRLRAVGTLRYSPTLKGSLDRRDGGTTRWWLIAECDPELGRYLRHLFTLGTWHTKKAHPPIWGPHISVIRGEEPPDKSAWFRHTGQAVEFEFSPEMQETEGYLWMPVWCETLLDYREELGLPRAPDPPLHLTVGNWRD